MNAKFGGAERGKLVVIVAALCLGFGQVAACKPTAVTDNDLGSTNTDEGTAPAGMTSPAPSEPASTAPEPAAGDGNADSSGGATPPFVPGQILLVGAKDLLPLSSPLRFPFLTDLGYPGAVALVDGSEPHDSPMYGPDAASLTTDPALLKMISHQEGSGEAFLSLTVSLDALPDEEVLSLCERINASALPVIASPNYYLTTSQPKLSPWDGKPVGVVDQALQYDVMRCTTMPNRCNLAHPAAIGSPKSIKVGVFDSSSYSAPTPQAIQPSLASPWDRAFVHIRQSPFPGNAGAHPDFADHGIFVSGLIRAFAPEADVILYRAFNEDGISTLGTVQAHVDAFITSLAQDERFVVNLSCNFNGANGSAPFESVLLAAQSKGGIVVASAGNMPQGNTNPQPPYYPATLPNLVIPVGGANSSRQRSCFSTDASTLVFGYAGDGMASASGDPCYTTNPSDAVASIVSDASPANYTDFKVAGWAGTSFAAAIISAQAARELAQWNVTTADKPCAGVPQPAASSRASQFSTDLAKPANQWGTTKVVNLAAMDATCH